MKLGFRFCSDMHNSGRMSNSKECPCGMIRSECTYHRPESSVVTEKADLMTETKPSNAIAGVMVDVTDNCDPGAYATVKMVQRGQYVFVTANVHHSSHMASWRVHEDDTVTITHNGRAYRFTCLELDARKVRVSTVST